MSFKVVWMSCMDVKKDLLVAYQARKLAPVAAFLTGDMPYVNVGSATETWGYTPTKVNKSSTVADFEAHYAQAGAVTGMRLLKAAVPGNLFKMWDDHEFGGDNFDGSIARANTAPDSIGAVSQAEVDEHFWRGRQAAANITWIDNPVNRDVGANPDTPSESLAGPEQYPVGYFRVGYNISGTRDDENPFAEFIVIDCISYRSSLTDADGPTKTMLGAQQKAWLQSRLLNSPATFKLILTPKKLYANLGADNADTWGYYNGTYPGFENERDEILQYILDQSITGVAWLAGDRHTPQVSKSAVADGDVYDHVSVCACPASVDINPGAAGSTYSAGHVWINLWSQVFGVAEVFTDYCELSIRTARTGAALWKGRILAGSNTLSYPSMRYG